MSGSAAAPDGTARGAQPGAALLELVQVMDRLRSPGGCPWDQQQTHESLAPYAVEEVYELLDAIDGLQRCDPGVQPRSHLREELGDVLLQVVFHARVAAEHDTEPFDIDDVARTLVAKLRRRHPHVFADGQASTPEEVSATWEQLKAAEQPQRVGVFDGIPPGLPELDRAHTMLRRLERSAGADRNRVLSDVLTAAQQSADPARRLGAALLCVVMDADAEGIDAPSALRGVLAEVAVAADRLALGEPGAGPPG